MKTILLSFYIASQAMAFDCSPPITLFEQNKFEENPFHATMDDQGTASLMWSKQSNPEKVRTVKMIANAEGKYLAPVVVSDKVGQALLSSEDEDELVATCKALKGNQLSFYQKETSSFVFELLFTERSPLYKEEKRGNLGTISVYLTLDDNFAIGTNESGKQFVFWEKEKRGDFHTLERVFLGAWRLEDGSWSHPETVVFSDPRFKRFEDMQVAIDSSGNVRIVGTVLSEGYVKGKAIWSLTRSAEGLWSQPVIITDYLSDVSHLQIEADEQGNILVVWGDFFEGTIYSVYKTSDQPWSSPQVLANKGDQPQLCNFGFRLRREQPGRCILVWQYLAYSSSNFYADPIFGSIFTVANGWSSPQPLSPREMRPGEFYKLQDYAVNREGDGILIWTKTNENYKRALIQASLFAFQ